MRETLSRFYATSRMVKEQRKGVVGCYAKVAADSRTRERLDGAAFVKHQAIALHGADSHDIVAAVVAGGTELRQVEVEAGEILCLVELQLQLLVELPMECFQ